MLRLIRSKQTAGGRAAAEPFSGKLRAMIAATVMVMAVLLGAVCGVLMRRNPLVRITPLGLTLMVISSVGLGGACLVWRESGRIAAAAVRRAWPTVDGIIQLSEVRGHRSYHPHLVYGFTVEGARYTGESTLQSPGFGPKSSRQEVARKSLIGFPLGGTVKVFYNPADPSENYLKPGASWDTFMRLSLGMILLIIGTAAAVLLERPATTAENNGGADM